MPRLFNAKFAAAIVGTTCDICRNKVGSISGAGNTAVPRLFSAKCRPSAIVGTTCDICRNKVGSISGACGILAAINASKRGKAPANSFKRSWRELKSVAESSAATSSVAPCFFCCIFATVLLTWTTRFASDLNLSKSRKGRAPSSSGSISSGMEARIDWEIGAINNCLVDATDKGPQVRAPMHSQPPPTHFR